MPNTYYLESKMLAHILGLGAFNSPPQVYMALGISAGSPAQFVELPPQFAYKRKSMLGFEHDKPFPNSYEKNRGGFQYPTATGPWQVGSQFSLTHYAMYDSLTGGNLLVWDALPNPLVVNVDDWVTVLPHVFELVGYGAATGGGAVDNLGQKIKDHVFNHQNYAPPTLKLVMQPTPPGGSGYMDVDVTGQWTAPSPNVFGYPTSSNNAAFQFPAATSSWGTVKPAITDGTILIMALGGPSYTINTDDQPFFDIGAISVEFH